MPRAIEGEKERGRWRKGNVRGKPPGPPPCMKGGGTPPRFHKLNSKLGKREGG